MVTVIGLVLMFMGFVCVLVACSMELRPTESYTLPAPPSRKSRKKLHRLSKMKKAS